MEQIYKIVYDYHHYDEDTTKTYYFKNKQFAIGTFYNFFIQAILHTINEDCFEDGSFKQLENYYDWENAKIKKDIDLQKKNEYMESFFNSIDFSKTDNIEYKNSPNKKYIKVDPSGTRLKVSLKFELLSNFEEKELTFY